MKKLILAGIGLFMMVGFLQAKETKTQETAECFFTTCGTRTCYLFPRDLSNKELLIIYDDLEANHCG